jgi:hypothetical protein
MSCYDEYKAERVAKAKKQHRNPLIDQFGTEGGKRATPPPKPGVPKPAQPLEKPAVPTEPVPPQPVSQQPQAPAAPDKPAPKPAAPKPSPSAEICDVCKNPITDFKVPLKGGGKVCTGCNEVLRDVAKSLILNIQCPHCGKDIQVTQA